MHKYGKKHHKCVKQNVNWAWQKLGFGLCTIDSFCLNPKLKTCQTLKQACDVMYTNQ
jgi:hypothetical protein